MFEAAMPVLAVTEITDLFFEYFLRRAVIMAWSSKDLPEPGGVHPVRLILEGRDHGL